MERREKIVTTTLWDAFESLARNRGEVDALLAPHRSPLRFADLPARLLQVRNSLADYGIGAEDRVVSVLPRGPETAVCYLGVAACATYIPLNPDYTENEFGAYLTELAPKAVILPDGVNSSARRVAQSLGIPEIDLAIDVAKPAGSFSLAMHKSAGSPIKPAWASQEHVALVVLTSGTTSLAKFVPSRQRHLLAYAHNAGKHYGLSSSDRCLHVMPMFHGHGLKSSLLIPLVNGSGVICPADFDIPSFFERVATFRPTWYSAAASIHRAIAEKVDGHLDIARQSSLRFIRSGSSRLDPKVMKALEEAFNVPVLERYGGSETGTLTSNPLPPGIRKPGSVGKPMFNEVKIIDEDGNFLPPNTGGEIVARGPSVFDGYLDNPDENTKSFVNGWFRTGDLGQFDDDGYLTLIGRKKDMINRGGEKIGTSEVEAAISSHPAVAEACVFSIPHSTLGEEVAAAVVASAGHTVTEAQIRTHGRSLLTGFKVPRLVFVLASLPKSATNKIQRGEVSRHCQELLRTRKDTENTSPHHWSNIEREIAELWADVLKVPSNEISPSDDFFLVGGDSLKAFELFLLIESQYRIRLGLRHAFDEAATVQGMALLVEHAREGKPVSVSKTAGLVSIKIEGDRPPLFAIPGSGGNPIGFAHLGRLLDERQPLIGIESRGMDGSMKPLVRMEAIAADNIERIKTIQPTGPYFLTGACYGARVAYEMARQLEAAGDEIGLLLMLDPSAPFHGASGKPRGDPSSTKAERSDPPVVRFILDRVALHASTLIRLRSKERRAYIREKLGALRSMIEHKDLFRGDRSELYQRAVYAANRAAGRRYVPGTFNGPTVVCFTLGRPVQGPRNYRLDWQQLVPQSGVPTFVSGKDSGDMTNVPHVYELAQVMNRWLSDAHETVRRSPSATAEKLT